jgi:hypothetical protein
MQLIINYIVSRDLEYLLDTLSECDEWISFHVLTLEKDRYLISSILRAQEMVKI